MMHHTLEYPFVFWGEVGVELRSREMAVLT